LYSTDSDSEVSAVQHIAREAGAFDAIACSHFARGGEGAKELAEAVERACQQPKNFQFLYDLEVCIECITE
jgi:formyltetrahydrofolate synthetase